MSDGFYFALKLIAATVSGVYGFYATITDFRVERNGQKVLSRKGYLGLALLVVSTAVSLSTDISKDSLDKKTAEKTERELTTLIDKGNDLQTKLGQTSADLQQQVKESQGISVKLDQTRTNLDTTRGSIKENVATTIAVLNQTRRILSPITRAGLTLDIEIWVPDQPLIRAYFDRVSRGGGFPDDYVKPTDGRFPDERRPEERELAQLANFTAVNIAFVAHDLPWLHRLFLHGQCGVSNRNPFLRYPSINTSFERKILASRTGKGPIILECVTSYVGWDEKRQPLASWLDLEGTDADVSVELPDDAFATQEDASRPQLEYHLHEVVARQGEDERFDVSAFSEQPCEKEEKGKREKHSYCGKVFVY